MEKIYMEENNQSQQQKSYNRKFRFSIVLSFAVAIFALFSLASFGLSMYGNNGGVSYAAPISGESFTFNKEKDSSNRYLIVVDTNHLYGQVPVLIADNNTGNPVFCVEHNSSIVDGKSYEKKGVIDDYGLLYLLNHSYANGKTVTDATGNNARYVEAWVTQVAIWMYLYENDMTSSGESSRNHIPSNILNDFKAATSLTLRPQGGAVTDDVVVYPGNGQTLYARFVKPLVEQAQAASNVKQLTVSIDTTNPASIAEDGSFYQSPIVTVAGDDLVNYDVTVSGVEGAYLVDENGNSLEANGITPGKKFFVRIPADKVGTETVSVTVNAKGHFNSLTGNYFTTAGTDGDGNAYQKVVTVTGTTTDVSNGASFEIVPTPPTGMNIAQTIYFIGLIVLLCGVGIVYANAKPVESKQ